jgi:excinuclease ABC subunit A
MGPEGGSGGGLVVATGTPEDVAQVAASHTGTFLAPLLAATPPASPRTRPRAKAAATGARAAKARVKSS